MASSSGINSVVNFDMGIREGMMGCVTSDLVDEFDDKVQACLTQFRQFGGISEFYGPIHTIETLEDNEHVRARLSTSGAGAVLVVDGKGSLRTALIGDRIAASALAHGWAGIILFGAVRDSAQLRKLPLGVKALGTVPVRSSKLGTGNIDVPVRFGGVTFHPGHWVYSDDDGILVSSQPLVVS